MLAKGVKIRTHGDTGRIVSTVNPTSFSTKGIYSKALRSQLLPVYDDFVANNNPLELKDEIALSRTLLFQALNKEKNLQKVIDEFLRSLDTGDRHYFKKKSFVRSLQVMSRKRSGDINRVLDSLRRLVETKAAIEGKLKLTIRIDVIHHIINSVINILVLNTKKIFFDQLEKGEQLIYAVGKDLAQLNLVDPNKGREDYGT